MSWRTLPRKIHYTFSVLTASLKQNDRSYFTPLGSGPVECSVSAEYWGGPGEGLCLAQKYSGCKRKDEDRRSLCFCWWSSEEYRRHSARLLHKTKNGGFQEDSESEEGAIILQGMEINTHFSYNRFICFVLERGSQNPDGVHQTQLWIRCLSGPQGKRNKYLILLESIYCSFSRNIGDCST